MNAIWVVTHSRQATPTDFVTWDKNGKITHAITEARVFDQANDAFDEAKTFAGAWIFQMEHEKREVPHITIWVGPQADALSDFKPRLRETRLADGTIKRATTLKERGLYFDSQKVFDNYTKTNAHQPPSQHQ